MVKRSVTSQLLGAQVWERAPAEPGSPPRGLFVAGWEDGDMFCASVCTNDVGLGFCRRCPEAAVARVLRCGLPARTRCPAGVGLLAFPAPRGSRDQVAVLRISPPTPRVAAAIASDVRVAPTTLRRAARRADEPDPRATLAAARLLRTEEGLRRWRLEQREAAADRRRTTTAALAQMIVTGEEYYSLYQASQRHLSELRRNRRQLDELAEAAFREQDRERARLAHQIHDTAVQSMVSAFRYVEAAALNARAAGSRGGSNGDGHDDARSGAVAVAGGPALAALDAATERMAVAIGELRSILSHLMPPGLEELGLASAIERRLEWLAVEGDLKAEMHGALPRLEPWVEQALYGMTAEAITNAVRHGRPRRVAVTLRTLRGRGIVEVRDDGVGFDRAGLGHRGAARSGTGLGLLGIERQAQWLGGSATVESVPGQGTRVRISVPVERYRRSGQEGAVPVTRTEEAT